MLMVGNYGVKVGRLIESIVTDVVPLVVGPGQAFGDRVGLFYTRELSGRPRSSGHMPLPVYRHTTPGGFMPLAAYMRLSRPLSMFIYRVFWMERRKGRINHHLIRKGRRGEERREEEKRRERITHSYAIMHGSMRMHHA